MKKYQRRNRACFAGAFISILICNTVAVGLQFIKGDVLDYAILGEAHAATQNALLLVSLILLEIAFHFSYNQFSARFIVGCTSDLKFDIFNSIMRRGYVEFKEMTQGEYIAKYTNEAEMIMNRRFSMQPLFWEILLKIVFVSAALFFLDWRIALITIILLTTPLYVPRLIEKKLRRAQTEYLKAVEVNLSKVNDWLSGFEVIKNFSIERKIMEKFKIVNDTSMEKMLRDKRLSAVAQLITTLLSYLSYFIVLASSAWLVIVGDFSAGDFFVAIGMIDQLSYPLISLAGIIRQLVAIKPACVSIEQFIISSDSCAMSGGGPVKVNRDIRFRGVNFAYEKQAPILRDFNFDMEKGGRYLLKGPSGCGKTTVLNLLLRYYDATSGEIEIDGLPISEAGGMYGLMTVLRQEAVLFHDTLKNNLTMYRDIPDDRLVGILEMLGLSKFGNADSLGGVVTENGSNLSGGEKKRICLARALLQDTDVLLIDEPLANLDDDTAGKIEDVLLSIEGKTMLVVSHQFSDGKLGAFSRVLDFAELENHDSE